jgi:hypothetical protein
MMDFLSDVFEFEVDTVSDSVYRGPLFLKLCEEAGASYPQSIVFSFRVKSEDELKEIMSKYNFFLYRKARRPEDSFELEKVNLETSERKTVLTLTDIDQRRWRFELETRSEF